jgi:hypothetical protein
MLCIFLKVGGHQKSQTTVPSALSADFCCEMRGLCSPFNTAINSLL